MAGITTPFTTPVFPFLQTVSQRTLDNITPAFVLASGPQRRADSADAGRRPRPGRVLGRSRSRVRATCSSGTRRCSASSTSNISVEVAYVGSKITRVGHARHQPQSADRRSARRWARRCCSACPIRSSASSRARRRSAIRRSPWPSCSSRIRDYTTVSLYRNNVGTTIYHGVYVKLEQRFSRGLSYLVSYTRSKLMDDASSVFDASILTGPVANFPVADSFNRKLERDYSTGDIPHVFVASAVWDLPFGAGRRYQPRRRARRARQRLDADRHAHAAVGHARRRSRRRPTTTPSPASAPSART